MAHGALGFGYGGGFFMPLIMIAFTVLLIIGTVYMFRLMSGSSESNPLKAVPKAAPVEVLKVRYARGELSKEEYESMKMDIS